MFYKIKDINRTKQDFFLSSGSCTRGGTWGCWGQKFIFSELGYVAYQMDGDYEKNRMLVKFSPLGHTGDLGVKRSNIIKF